MYVLIRSCIYMYVAFDIDLSQEPEASQTTVDQPDPNPKWISAVRLEPFVFQSILDINSEVSAGVPF
jgi:hypothetical protein